MTGGRLIRAVVQPTPASFTAQPFYAEDKFLVKFSFGHEPNLQFRLKTWSLSVATTPNGHLSLLSMHEHGRMMVISSAISRSPPN